MRLPWLQIDADGQTRGEMLGRRLEIGPDAGIGLVIRVWRWALEMAPDGDFSGGPHDALALAAGVGCADIRLADELSRCGLAVVVMNAGLVPVSFVQVRIKGLDRYRRAWEKNKRRKPALVVPVTGNMSAGTGENRRDQRRKTETETDIKEQARAKKPRVVDPRFGPLMGRLKAAHLEVTGNAYDPSDADGSALRGLLAKGDDDEIDRRYRKGLSAGPFDTKCATLLQLAQRWTDLGIERAPRQAPRPVTKTLTAYELAHLYDSTPAPGAAKP